MLFSRRQFLKATTITHATTLYSPLAFSCGAGPDRVQAVIAPAPAFDFLSDGLEDGIEQFLNKEYRRGRWEYSKELITFRAPPVAEYHRNIPIEIRTANSNFTERYRSLAIFFQRFVSVTRYGEFCSSSCSPNKSAITRVAKFEFGEYAVSDISTRVQVPYDSDELKLIAALTNKVSGRVEVVKQNSSIKLRGCFFEIDGYIDKQLKY